VLPAVVATAATAGCSGPPPNDEAKDRVLADVILVRDALARRLGGVPTQASDARAFVRAAVQDAGVRSAMVADATWRGPMLLTTLVFTVRVQRGGGLNYESWTTRGCVSMAGPHSAGLYVSVQDVPCPAAVTPDPGPADTTVPVAP